MKQGYLLHALLVMMTVSAYRGCRDAPPEYPDGVATLCGVATKRFEIILPYDVFRIVPKKDRPGTFDKTVTAPLMVATTITRQAEHGQIEGPSGTRYFYLPNQGFEGEDQFTLQSIYKEQTITLNYRIFVSADESKLNRHTNWPRERGQRSDCEKPPFQAKISDSPSRLSVKLHWEGVSFPSPMATVETPAVRKGARPPHLPYGRGFKPELVLRRKSKQPERPAPCD